MSQPWDYEYRHEPAEKSRPSTSVKDKIKSALWGMTMVGFVYFAIAKHLVKTRKTQ